MNPTECYEHILAQCVLGQHLFLHTLKQIGLEVLKPIFPQCRFLLCIFNFSDKKKKSEPIPNRDEVRISWVWWSIADSNR
jgi:hypothetical protein